jgi:tetratricopeptide (TPR) repeat protein
LKRYEDAIESYDRALAINPAIHEAHYNRGNALKDLKRFQEALDSFEHALALNPHDHETLNNRGSALLGLQRHAEALSSYERALELKPDYAEAHYNRANALKDLQRYVDALQSYDRAIALKPDYAEAFNNRGNLLEDMRRFDEALADYDRAEAIDPNYAAAHWNEGLCRLRLGDFERGWQKYEWGSQSGERVKSMRQFEQPLWRGAEALDGKTILLYAEQGLGDTLQFCRYAAMVGRQAAGVLLEVQPPLKSLLAQIEGVHVLARGEALPDFNYHCPLVSLPLAFHTKLDTIPAPAQYLRADASRVEVWLRRLGESPKRRVGLVWSGSASHRNDRNRSIPLSQMAQLVSAQFQFISLQKELRRGDEDILRENANIEHVGADLADFADTAALIELLDLVITIDTSVAHLAGAMNKPVWILLPFNSDFRWLLHRDDSPWYPSAKLFRQPAMGDWDSVLARVKRELARIIPPAR